MTSEAELKPNVINELIRSKNKNIYQEIGDVTKARYLISHRKKIGFADKTIGLSPEEIGKLKDIQPDFTLIHPDSSEALLQRYILLDYSSKDARARGEKVLRNNPNIISVSDNDVGMFSATTPDDPLFQNLNNYQWGLYELNIQNAWDKTKGHSYIGIVDSGLDVGNTDYPNAKNHPDLGNFRSQFSLAGSLNNTDMRGNCNANDESCGHGTHVAGLIAGKSDNNEGLAGICWNCSISMVRVERPIFQSGATPSESYRLCMELCHGISLYPAKQWQN
jgi:subtilisin family serine protease